MLSNFIKEILLTSPELIFFQSVLLMYGTIYLFQLILDLYHCSCIMFAIYIYQYNFSVYYV